MVTGLLVFHLLRIGLVITDMFRKGKCVVELFRFFGLANLMLRAFDILRVPVLRSHVGSKRFWLEDFGILTTNFRTSLRLLTVTFIGLLSSVVYSDAKIKAEHQHTSLGKGDRNIRLKRTNLLSLKTMGTFFRFRGPGGPSHAFATLRSTSRNPVILNTVHIRPDIESASVMFLRPI